MSLSPTVKWRPAPESDLAGYRVYFGIVSLNYTTYREVAVPCRPFLKMVGMEKYVTMFFRVAAFDTSNNVGPFSDEVSTFVSGGLILK
jgi:hypothetical protein